MVLLWHRCEEPFKQLYFRVNIAEAQTHLCDAKEHTSIVLVCQAHTITFLKALGEQ